jgi:hypothetical protein
MADPVAAALPPLFTELDRLIKAENNVKALLVVNNSAWRP